MEKQFMPIDNIVLVLMKKLFPLFSYSQVLRLNLRINY
jgi:hypothetical protein